jgi:hypothetical protein
VVTGAKRTADKTSNNMYDSSKRERERVEKGSGMPLCNYLYIHKPTNQPLNRIESNPIIALPTQSNPIQCRTPSKGRFYNCHPKSTPTWLVPKASHNCCPEKPTRRSPKLKRETSKSLHPSIFIFLPTRKPSKQAPFASTTRHHSTSVLKEMKKRKKRKR